MRRCRRIIHPINDIRMNNKKFGKGKFYMKSMRIYILLVVLGLAVIPVGIRAFDWFSPIPKIETESVSSAMCEEHGLISGQCPFCDPALIETQGFCAGHGVPEALCHRCSPELEAAFRKQGDWCGGHNVPESQCEICNPGILDKYNSFQAQTGLSVTCGSIRSSESLSGAESDNFFDDFDGSDDVETFPRYKKSPAVGCTTQDLRVTFPDAQIPSQVGIETTAAIALSVPPEISCDAVIDYDRSSYTRISSPASGILKQVNTDLGNTVKKGDVLAVVDSEEFGAAKAAFLETDIRLSQLALEYDRAMRLFEKQISSEKDMLESKTRVDECRVRLSGAKQRLKNLGLTENDINRMKKNNDTSSLLSIESPLSGVVVKRNGVNGELVSSSHPLFDIAAVDKMWALLNVHEPDLAKVSMGQQVMITISGLEGNTYEGMVSWISTAIDPATRSLQVRVDVDNTGGRIKAGMFGNARILLAVSSQAIGIPVASVQWDGCCNLVFVKVSDLVYAPRKVKIGFRTGDYYAVNSGLTPGEQVVTQGSFILKTEILKSNIGAGCCPES
jgi:cobalt-zinc-cadmium efflux system membrane fusion protein